MPKNILIVFDPDTLMPRAAPAIDLDAWNKHDGGLRMAKILIALIDAGYQGVRYWSSDWQDGQFTWSPQYNTQTPEGRLFEEVLALASQGGMPPSVNECLARVKTSYLDLGLPLPSNNNAR